MVLTSGRSETRGDQAGERTETEESEETPETYAVLPLMYGALLSKAVHYFMFLV